MAIGVGIIEEVIGIASNILQAVGVLTGMVNKKAEETAPLIIQTIASNAANTVNDPVHGNAPILADINAIRTGTHLTLQSVIDALPGTPPVTLPTVPPSGYGGSTAADVWTHQVVYYPWQSDGPLNPAGDALQQAAIAAVANSQGSGFVYADAPDFALVGDHPSEVSIALQGILFTPTPEPTGIDWTTWNGTDTIVQFLNTVASGISWSYTNWQGVVTPGWAWGTIGAFAPHTRWFCRVSDADLPGKATRIGGAVAKAQNLEILGIAVGLAALFATGGGDVSSIVTMVGTLVSDYVDLPTALGALMTWLSGRSQDTNQENQTALTTLTTDVTTLTNSGTHTLQSILDVIAALPAPDNSDITYIKGKVDSIETTVNSIHDLVAALRPGAPVWPGAANVTLGSPVSLVDQLVVNGPMDGLIVDVTGAPVGASHWLIGGLNMYYAWGEVAFEADDGYMEPFQWLAAGNGLYLPKQLKSAAHALFRIRRDATGTVTPFVHN